MKVSTGSTSTTRALNQLFARGLVAFGNRPGSGRLRNIVLTPLGQAEQIRLRSLRPQWGGDLRAHEWWLRRFDPERPVWAWERRAAT